MNNYFEHNFALYTFTLNVCMTETNKVADVPSSWPTTRKHNIMLFRVYTSYETALIDIIIIVSCTERNLDYEPCHYFNYSCVSLLTRKERNHFFPLAAASTPRNYIM